MVSLETFARAPAISVVFGDCDAAKRIPQHASKQILNGSFLLFCNATDGAPNHCTIRTVAGMLVTAIIVIVPGLPAKHGSVLG